MWGEGFLSLHVSARLISFYEMPILEGCWSSFWFPTKPVSEGHFADFFFSPAPTLFIISKFIINKDKRLILQAANSSWEAKGGQSTSDQNTSCLPHLFLFRGTFHLLGILLRQRWFLWHHQMVQSHFNQNQQMFPNIRGRSWMLWCAARKTPLGPAAMGQAEPLLWSLQS